MLINMYLRETGDGCVEFAIGGPYRQRDTFFPAHDTERDE